jgi:N-acetylmuramoyl-L-alanine amidase
MRINSPNYSKGRVDSKTGKRYIPNAIVLHITDGSFNSTRYWFEDSRSQVSSHWLVDENGTAHPIVDEKDTAWHAGRVVNPTWKGLIPHVNPNLYTIGIEVVNRGEFPPWKQWKGWVMLCRDISRRYNMPLNELHVANHYEIRGNKTCPKSWFSRSYLLLLNRIIK